MAEADLERPAQGPGELLIDPFGYMPDAASRIAGLGGEVVGADRTYLFHTPYVAVAPGPAHFSVAFAGLRAKRGTISLRVHMLRPEPGSHATLVNSEHIRVNRLVANEGRASLRFEGFRGMTFAFVATISEDSDAAADAIAVTLDRPADPNAIDEDEVAVEAHGTAYGSKAIRPAARLLAVEPPRLAQPTSQAATQAQLAEPIFRQTLRLLGGVAGDAAHQWQVAYVYQALQRYGLLQPGARGVGFAVARGVLPAALAAAGAEILATDPVGSIEGDDPAALALLERPVLCDPARFADSVSHRAISLDAIPRSIVNFDFLWSVGAAERLGTVAAGLAFVEQAMTCLRPGGLAVHTFAFDPAGAGRVVDGGRAPPFLLPDLERLALNLVSRGHEVAQIRVDNPLARASAGAVLPAFGLIARKAQVNF